MNDTERLDSIISAWRDLRAAESEYCREHVVFVEGCSRCDRCVTVHQEASERFEAALEAAQKERET